MSDAASLISTIDRLSTPVAVASGVVFVVAIIGFYSGSPGFSLISQDMVGALSVAALLSLTIPLVKWWVSRPKVVRVAKRFRALSDTQKQFLRDVRLSQKNWFKGFAEDQPWFKELEAFGYVQIARPFILFPGEPWTYEITAHGLKELSRSL
jgi:hypothetical protein